MPIPPDKYKNVIYEGATFPDDMYRRVKVKLNDTITKEYIPAIPPDTITGLRLFITAMTHQEGFRGGAKPTRSYRTNNPGNIGNTDSGANVKMDTLTDGIQLQALFIKDIAAGKKKAFPLGKEVFLKPAFSQEIQNNLKNYNAKSGYIPGYRFKYTGQLDQFVKIYATLPRINNSYINTIVSYFADNGITIYPFSTLAEIIEIGAPELDLGGKVGAGI